MAKKTNKTEDEIDQDNVDLVKEFLAENRSKIYLDGSSRELRLKVDDDVRNDVVLTTVN